MPVASGVGSNARAAEAHGIREILAVSGTPSAARRIEPGVVRPTVAAARTLRLRIWTVRGPAKDSTL